MPSSILRATTGDAHPSYPGNDRIVPLPTSCTGASASSPTPTTSIDLVVLDGQTRVMPRPTPPSSAAAASPTGLSAKIARRAWPRGTPASEQPVYQSYLPTAPQSARTQPLSPGSHRQVVSAHQGSMSARQPQYDERGHRIGGRPGSAPGKGRGGSPLATKESAKQLQFELAMTGQVFKCAHNELELERRRTRDARAQSERQLAQLLAEQRAALERELVDSEKVAQERLAQERAEREARAQQQEEIEEQLAEIESLKMERDEARRESEALLVAERDKHARALERLRVELSGSAEEVQAARQAQARQERLEAMQSKAMARIKNQGLIRGWGVWAQQWATGAKQRRQLAAAGARLMRPQLIAKFGHWRADWAAAAGKEAAKKAKGSAQLLEEAEQRAAKLQQKVAQLQEQHAEALAMAQQEKQAALARQRDELLGSAEAQQAAREEAAREARVEQMKAKAMGRIKNQGIMAGWARWHEQWEEVSKQKRQLAAAGARLTRPQLVKTFGLWKADWQGEAALSLEQQIEKRDGAIEALEKALQSEKAAAASLLEAAEAKARELEAKIKALLAGQMDAEAQAALKEEAARERRVEELKAKAMRRIANQGLMKGWAVWHDVWEAKAKKVRMLAAAGAKLMRPQLVASLAAWKADWTAEMVAQKGATFEQRLKQSEVRREEVEEELASQRAKAARLAVEVDELRTAAEHARRAAEEKHAAAIERLRKELTGSAEEQAAAREAAAREARIEQMKAKAMGRIKNQGIMAGWSQWHEVWSEAAKQKRQLAAAGARLTRPLLVKTFSEWKSDWSAAAAEAAAEAAKGHKQQLREAKTRARELEKELSESKAAHKAELAAAERRRRELETQLSSAPSADKLAEEMRKKEEAAMERRVEEMKAKATRRLKNQGIITGWGRWHEQWAERARRRRLMQHAASKLVRPKLVQGFARFKANRAAARASLDAAAGSSALEEQRRLNAELRAELEKLREESTSNAAKMKDELVARTRAEDRERRVERAQSSAAKKLVHKDLARGWHQWEAMARAHNRRVLLLSEAARRIHRPKLMAAWSFWTTEHQRMRRDAAMRQVEREADLRLREAQRQAEAKLVAERKAATEARRELDAHVKELKRQLEAYHISVAEAPPPDPVVIVLHGISASGVPDADAAGGADPYARFAILLDSQTPKKEMAYTTYKVSDVNPVWEDERLQLRIAPEDPRPLTLRVEMWDKDMNSPDDIMAAADVKLDPATMVVGGTATHTLRLKGVDDSDDVEEFTFSYTLLAEEEEAPVVDKAKVRAAKEALAKKAGLKTTSSDALSSTKPAANPTPGGRKR